METHKATCLAASWTGSAGVCIAVPGGSQTQHSEQPASVEIRGRAMRWELFKSNITLFYCFNRELFNDSYNFVSLITP